MLIIVTGYSRKRTTAGSGWRSEPDTTRTSSRYGSAYDHISDTRRCQRG